MTHFNHTITKNPIKSGFCQCEEVSVMAQLCHPQPER
jgi:hypothetical protein